MRWLIDRVWVSRCIACSRLIPQGKRLCEKCEGDFREERRWECGRCGIALTDCLCVNEEMDAAGIKRSVKLLRYRPDEPTRLCDRIIFRVKTKFIRRIHIALAEELAQSVTRLIPLDGSFIVTYVPRTRSRLRQCGFDQSRSLGKALATVLSLPFFRTLERAPITDAQKTLVGAEERRKNALKSFLPHGETELKGRRVLLVDDIITTGASVIGAARVLRKMGAKEVIPVTVAVSYRHPNVKYEHIKNSREDKRRYDTFRSPYDQA